jgi:probable HAF family extracellular repeat protein
MFRMTNLSVLLAALLVSPLTLAPGSTMAAKAPASPRYRVVDLGSLGGSIGMLQGRSINLRGMAVGLMSTANPDPFGPNCFFDCNVDHAFLYANGKTWDLGALAGNASSAANGISDFGIVYGQAQNGITDPLTGFPEAHAVWWVNRKIIDLGTLGGSQSAAWKANLLGQTVGASLTAQPDPFAFEPMAACRFTPITGTGSNWMSFAENSFFAPGATETHATLWWGGAKVDMGTLGGPDSVAADVNLLGQAVGWSYASYQANQFGVPDVRPFLWNPLTRKMRDLGSLGGACSIAAEINNRGDVIGHSTLANNTTEHPFLWTARGGMRDLGTLGGGFAHANHINDRGEIVGYSTMVPSGQGQAPTYLKGRAFYWKDGTMTNLGTFGDDYSDVNGINNRGQIVGETFDPFGDATHGWISERGGPIVDLDTLIDPNSGFHIIAGVYIGDDGEIGARAIAPDGTEHPVKLVPVR